jgi:transcription initiation factor TFIIB
MTEPTEEINQELDDILLDDLVEVQERTPGTEEPNLTPGEAVYDDRRDDIVEAEISRISGELELSESTQRTAMSLFDQYAGQNDLTGNAIEVLAGACLYTACKVESVPLSPDDFVSVPEAAFTRNILLQRVKLIASTLGLNPQAFSDPTHYVDYYCEDLGLDDEITERAHGILTKADEAGIGGGKSPTGRAAAAVYLASIESDRKVTQADIADTADVSEVTIRNRYRDQAEILS